MPVKYRVNIARAAEDDISAVWNHIAADNPSAADRFIAELEHQASTLEEFPLRCPLIPEADALGISYRHLLYGAYRTIFRVDRHVVYIMRVVHGARLLDT